MPSGATDCQLRGVPPNDTLLHDDMMHVAIEEVKRLLYIFIFVIFHQTHHAQISLFLYIN